MTSFLAALSGLVSVALTIAVRQHAVRKGVLDRPNARSSHNTPTPRGGGIAILGAALLGIAIGVAFRVIEPRHALTLGVGMLTLGVIGWLDDTRGVRPRMRLFAHTCAAVWTLFMLGGLSEIRIGSASLALGAAGYVMGAIGIVWSINLFNFMDGIDGLAGSQAVLIFGSAALLSLSRGEHSLGVIAAILAAASAGFLVWNWPPAKIFLGDVGSGAVGYLVAAMAIASENIGSIPLLAFAIIGGVFIADASVTLIRRLLRGRRAMEAHRDHAYQRLARTWGSHRSVALAAAAATTLLAVIGAIGTMTPRLLLPGLVFAYLLLGGLLLAAERRAPM
jgi:Fuc2NAc and GlcNAc transferase